MLKSQVIFYILCHIKIHTYQGRSNPEYIVENAGQSASNLEMIQQNQGRSSPDCIVENVGQRSSNLEMAQRNQSFDSLGATSTNSGSHFEFKS